MLSPPSLVRLTLVVCGASAKPRDQGLSMTGDETGRPTRDAAIVLPFEVLRPTLDLAEQVGIIRSG